MEATPSEQGSHTSFRAIRSQDWSVTLLLARVVKSDHARLVQRRPLARCCLLCQVVPASVRSVPSDGTAERPLGAAPPTGSDLSEAAMQPVVQDGHITYWPGFEALLHYTLYQQVSKSYACTCYIICCLTLMRMPTAGLAGWRRRQCDYARAAFHLEGTSVLCNIALICRHKSDP